MNFEKSFQLLQGDCRSELGLRKIEKFEAAQGTKIQKVKFAPKDYVLRLYDLELRLPVNPFKPEDTTYSKDAPWISPLAVDTTILTMKKFFAENKETLAAFLKKLFIKEWDVSQVDEFTEMDFEIFRPYRSAMHYSHAVQNYKYSVLGQWGRNFISNAQIENGIPIKSDTGWDIYQLELAIAKTRVDAFNETCKEGGENASLSDDDKKSERSKIWKTMLVGNPYEKGVSRCHDMKITKETRKNIKCDILHKDVVEELGKFDAENTKENPLDKYARYFSCNGSELDKINQWINTKFDKYPNFIMVTLYYPEDKTKDEDDLIVEAYAQRTFNNNPDVEDIPENLQEIYRAYRNEYDLHYKEALMLESVYDFGAISDERNLEFYKNELLASSKIKYITEDVFKFNKALITRIDPSLAEKIQDNLLDMDDDNTIAKVAPKLEDLEKGLVGDEDMPVDADKGEEGEVSQNIQKALSGDVADDDDELFAETAAKDNGIIAE